MSGRLFLTPLQGKIHWSRARTVEPSDVPMEFGEREDSQQRERSSHVSLFPKLMAFGFPFLYRGPDLSVS